MTTNPVASNNRNSFSHPSRGQKPEIKVPKDHTSYRGSRGILCLVRCWQAFPGL